MSVLHEGGLENVQGFFHAMSRLAADCREQNMWYRIISAPRNQDGHYEIQLNVKGRAHTLVIKAVGCTLVLRDGHAFLRYSASGRFHLKMTLHDMHELNVPGVLPQ